MKEWAHGRVKDLIESLESGVSVNGTDDAPSANEPAVLKVSAVTYGIFDPQASKPIRSEMELRRAKCNPRSGEIIISRSNAPSMVGASAYVRDDFPHRFLPDKLWQTIQKENISTDMRWLSFFLASPWTRYRLSSLATGTSSSMKNITKSELMTLPLPIPPLSEQKAIADLLSNWDKAIETTERLIQAKERQKIGERHSLISSQRANLTIGSLVKPVARKIDKPDEPYVALGIRSHFKGTFQRLVEDPKTVNMDSLFRVKKNDLIVNITFAWEGAIALVKPEDEECYVSHRFPTYEIKRSKAEPCFIRQLIMSSRMKYDLSNISPGGAGRNRVLNKKDFLKMPIWLPDLKTQKHIGEYLGAIDNEIDLLKQLAEKYKTQKRGLMQKMLTGEWRVKPEIVKQYMEA